MSILLTGGTGKTGGPLAQLLLEHGKVPFIIASRSGNVPSPYKSVKFDWMDQSTYENPFNPALLPEGIAPIDRVYLVAPNEVDSPSFMRKFVDLARARGVKRFVLLSGSPLEAGGPAMGVLHQYLMDIGVEYCVLRPTWFMQNFSTYRASGIKDADAIYSATEDGKIAFISTEDIAQAAFEGLLDEKSHNTDHILVGPELLSYDETAVILSSVLGRTITHKKLSRDEFIELGLKAADGQMSREYAEMLADMDVAISQGSEAKWVDSPKKKVGKVTLRDFAERHKALWEKIA